MSRNQLSPEAQAERDQRIAELTRNGYTAKQIADEVLVTIRTVVRVRVRLGISQPAPQRMTDTEIQFAEMLLEDGASFSEVARSIGHNMTTVRNRFPGRGWDHGSGIEYRRLLAALDAIPDNIVSLRRQFRDPVAVTINHQLQAMRAAFYAIPEEATA